MNYNVPIDHVEQQFPEYEVVRALTPSAQKAAFHVRDRASGEELCLKLISPNSDIDRVTREIEALQELAHPNVVTLYEYTYSSKPDQRRHYIIEEFIAGSDLADELRPGRPWDQARVIEFFALLCDGLAALSAQQIVHRDLKPANVRVRTDGSPVIIDFGLARRLDQPDLTATGHGARIGTPTYFAPEQFRGTKRDIDHRTDLFALGVIMHEALVGAHPFYDPNIRELAELERAVCEGEAFEATAEFGALPRSFQLLLSKLLAKDRIRRPASADQVARILRRIA